MQVELAGDAPGGVLGGVLAALRAHRDDPELVTIALCLLGLLGKVSKVRKSMP